MPKIDKQKIEIILTRGVEEIIDFEHLRSVLLSGKRLRVKLGIDPTSPNLHLGRAIPLLKLKDFQELGHQVVFIIGDFTGVIGDTSDKDSERLMLDPKIVKENMKTYVKQIGKILDIKKCEIRYNSEWLKKLGYHEIGEQADVFSLNEFISRENISNRLKEGKRVSLREVLYPLMQGYDSVAVRADVEVGGRDQRFNLLAGRELQRHYGQNPQDIITNPLIEGLDGRKMSSSWGNTINLLDSADEMFGKIMSLRDDLIIRYFTLATRLDMELIKQYDKEMKEGANPRDYKLKLAKEIVRMYHGDKKAETAEQNFRKVFQLKQTPTRIPEYFISEEKVFLPSLLKQSKMVSSAKEAKRLILAGAVEINGQVYKEWEKPFSFKGGEIIKVGKRRFLKIKKR